MRASKMKRAQNHCPLDWKTRIWNYFLCAEKIKLPNSPKKFMSFQDLFSLNYFARDTYQYRLISTDKDFLKPLLKTSSQTLVLILLWSAKILKSNIVTLWTSGSLLSRCSCRRKRHPTKCLLIQFGSGNPSELLRSLLKRWTVN